MEKSVMWLKAEGQFIDQCCWIAKKLVLLAFSALKGKRDSVLQGRFALIKKKKLNSRSYYCNKFILSILEKIYK